MSGGADDRFLLRALDLARRAWGETHPNPMVGALVVEGATVVAEGWHARAGEPHAEVVALRGWSGRNPEAAVLYITLEPCSTHGRTPPCVDAIIQSGVRQVVVGTVDPNPLHAGRGLTRLREAGIAVRLAEGSTERACRRLNLIFNHVITQRRPLVALKVARDSEGRTIPVAGARYLTGPAALADVMHWRQLFPAIVVGAGTVMADNPRLSARLTDGDRFPIRLILDPSGRLMGQRGLHVLSDAQANQTRVLLDPSRAASAYAAWLAAQGVTPWLCEGNDFLSWAFRRAGQEGISGMMVEAGPTLGRALLAGRHLDYGLIYIATEAKADPCTPAWLPDPLPLTDADSHNFGPDRLDEGFWSY